MDFLFQKVVILELRVSQLSKTPILNNLFYTSCLL